MFIVLPENINFVSLLLKIYLPWGLPPGALPIHPTCPWVKITRFIPVQEQGAAVGGLPLPSPTALLAWPLWPWWHLDAGLWGFVAVNRRETTPLNTVM